MEMEVNLLADDYSPRRHCVQRPSLQLRWKEGEEVFPFLFTRSIISTIPSPLYGKGVERVAERSDGRVSKLCE